MDVEKRSGFSEPQPPISLLSRSNRRDFLRLLGATSLGVAASGAFRVLNPEIPRTAEITPAELDRTNRLFLGREILALPDSAIKGSLISRMLPLLEDNPSKEIMLGGMSIRVQPIKVMIGESTNSEIQGSSDMWEDDSPVVYFNSDQRLKMPYLGLVKPEERSSFSTDNSGTAFLDSSVSVGDSLIPDLTPYIKVTIPQQAGRSENLRWVDQEIKKFVAVKEVISLWLIALFIEATINKMKALNMSTMAEVNLPGMKPYSTEFVTGALKVIDRHVGRLLLSLDIGATVATLKAYQGTAMIPLITRSDSRLATANSQVAKIDLGNNEQDILFNSLKLAYTDHKLLVVPHHGSLQFP